MSNLLNHYTLCSGVGHSAGKHNSFDQALIDAGISDYNLIKISSILPPNCMYEPKVLVPKGLLLPTAVSVIFSNVIGTQLSAAIAVGIPQDSNDIGVIMEYSSYSAKQETENLARNYVCQAMKDRCIDIRNIISISSECYVELPEYYCAFAALALW